MDVTILGTAAAEAWPAPFCSCDACEEARRRGGPNLRFRSGALVGNDVKIDFGPDTVAQTLKFNLNLSPVQAIVFTHHHSDHIVPEELEWLSKPYTNTPSAEPVAVYGNEIVLKMIREVFSQPEKNNLTLHLLEPLVSVTLPNGDTVLPLPADHAPGSLVLRIARAEDGRVYFHGHDSGLYPEATLDALAKESPVDIATFDCTYGGQESKNRGHMGIDGVIQMATEFKKRGITTDKTKLVATHFSHNGGLLHEELVEAFLPHGIMVAFDGMVVRV